MQRMHRKNRFKKKNNDFIRRFTAGVKPVEIDATGRLLIPRNLMSVAEIDKEVVLSSAINIIEIWDKERWQQEMDFREEHLSQFERMPEAIWEAHRRVAADLDAED